MFNQDASGEGGGLLAGNSAFSEENVRRGFVRKVYSILSLQLLVTMGIMGIFFADSVRDFAMKNTWMMWLSFCITFACLIALACCEGVRRNSPGNLICLGVFTIAEGFTLGIVVATYE